MITGHLAVFGFRPAVSTPTAGHHLPGPSPLTTPNYPIVLVLEFMVVALLVGWMVAGMMWWIDKQSHPRDR